MDKSYSAADRAQISNFTKFNRYPVIFRTVAALMGGKGRVLSFGCSTGEELLSLSKYYFDHSTIVGVDVSTRAVKIALKRVNRSKVSRSNKIFAFTSKQLEKRKRKPFDCVFAMSVLCRWTETEDQQNISSIYAFQDFDRLVSHINKKIKPGGLLVIINSNYFFEDTDTAKNYEPVPGTIEIRHGYVHRYEKDGARSGRTGCVIFRKKASWIDRLSSRASLMRKKVRSAIRKRLRKKYLASR